MKRADVTLESGQARVTYDDSVQLPEKLAAAIGMLGFKASVVSVVSVVAAPRSEAPPKR